MANQTKPTYEELKTELQALARFSSRVCEESVAIVNERNALKVERDRLHAALAALSRTPFITTVPGSVGSLVIRGYVDHDGTGPSIAAALVRLHEECGR